MTTSNSDGMAHDQHSVAIAIRLLGLQNNTLAMNGNRCRTRAEAARAALTWLQNIELARHPTHCQQNPHPSHNTSFAVVNFTQPIQHEDSRSSTDEAAPSSSESAIELIASSLPPSVLTT